MNPIARMLIDMARFYGTELEERQLEMYVEMFARFEMSLVLRAGKEYVADIKNTRFPMPPHKILENYLPRGADERSMAIEAANRAVAAVSKFGWPSPEKAREYVGELGWRAIERMGGWQYFCENLGVTLQLTTVQAQIRDACEATLRLGDAGIFDRPIGLPESRGEKKRSLTSAADIVKGLLPEGK